jgi:hypothetical protein
MTTSICYATNTIKILFMSETNQIKYFFNIDPPWRIILNGKLIQTSYNYPHHNKYVQDKITSESEAFYEWCSITEFMKADNIQNITVHDNADLTIEWENGAILDAFINDNEGASYYFYDKINYKVYEFEYGKCTVDDLERQEIE